MLVFFNSPSRDPANPAVFTLKSPRKNQKPLSPDHIQLFIKKALLQLLKGTSPSYGRAQDLLIKAFEGDTKNVRALAFLCFVYKELWPQTSQSFKSLKSVVQVVHQSSVLNRGGPYFQFCAGNLLVIKKNHRQAKTFITQALNELSRNGEEKAAQDLLPFFYYLKAEVLLALGDITTMGSYVDTIKKMLPQWIKPDLLKGQALLRQGKSLQALKLYQDILKLFPSHTEAKVRLGVLEALTFHQVEKGGPKILSALPSLAMLPYHLTAQAYFATALWSSKQGKTSEALKYALKSYQYNPLDSRVEKWIVKAKGAEVLKTWPVKDRLLVEKGDQLAGAGRLQEAVSHYEEAFRVSRGKNASVALKTAESMWKLNFFSEALEWLKKAIQADPSFVKPYILMSRYYVEMHDFSRALKTLDLAFKKFTRSYEVYRGLAYLSLSRKEYKNALQYAQVALKIHELDIESYVILSEAHLQMAQFEEALSVVGKALEMDPHSPGVQTAYARALGGMYGVDSGSGYFEKLVNKNSSVLEYRIAWARFLTEEEKHDEAYHILNQLIELNPNYKEAYFYLGQIFMFNDNYPEAYQAFLKTALLSPGDPRPTFHIGLLRLKEKKLNSARRAFQKVLALNPLYPEAHYYLGRIAFLKGGKSNYHKAVEEARRESENNPHFSSPFVLAGEAYEQLREFLPCAGEYQKAIEQAPENHDFYIRTARCYRKAGYLDLAVNILKKILNTKGQKTGEPDLYQELGMILEMRSNDTLALGAYCNYLNLRPGAKNREKIEKRIHKLSQKTGRKIKCEYSQIKQDLLLNF